MRCIPAAATSDLQNMPAAMDLRRFFYQIANFGQIFWSIYFA